MAKKISNDPIQAARAMAVADLAAFASLVSPGFELAPHVDLLCHRLEALEAGGTPIGKLKRLVGKRQDRLILSEPPRHGKTTLVAILFVSWYLGRHPDRSVIVASYSQDRVDDIGRSVRNIMTSPEFQSVFPNCRLMADTSASKRFDLTDGGSFYAVGRGGPITGRGCNLLVIDDLLKDAEEARSEVTKKSMVEWFQTTAFTRLAAGGAVCVVGTRWAQDDLSGWLQSEFASEGWESLNLPAISEGQGDPLGRPEGHALWPSRFNEETLASIKRQIGGSAWAQLYMGQPGAAGGTIFLRRWFKTHQGPLPAFSRVLISLDTAMGLNSKSGDHSVASVWGVASTGYYLIHLWRARADFPSLRAMLRELCHQYRPYCVLIEQAVSGISLAQDLKAATSFPVLSVPVAGRSKRARAELTTPLFESGRVWFCDASWRAELEDELAAVPFGRHDDQCDSVSMALNWLREQSYDDGPPPFIMGGDDGPSLRERILNYVNGIKPVGPISAATSRAICDGAATSLQEDEVIMSTIAGALDDDDSSRKITPTETIPGGGRTRWHCDGRRCRHDVTVTSPQPEIQSCPTCAEPMQYLGAAD